jgi:hypothetical protein
MNTEPTVEREPTSEEIAEMKQRMAKYYEEQIPFLKTQKEYEELLADIEIARARRIEMTIRIAQMTMGPQNEADDEQETTESVKRPLKKEK